MAWTEVISKRGRGSRTYRDTDNPRRHVMEAQAGTRYKLINHITAASGREEDRTITIICEER